MRRRPGISGLQRGQQTKEQYRAFGEHAAEVRLEQMRSQMVQFRKCLEDFAMKHKNEIRKDPAFRHHFHKMCANCGVDPLQSNKGMFAEVLGFGDFYYELGVQIVEACLVTREINGGLLDMGALLSSVKRRRGSASADITEDDVVRAARKLKVLGSGFAVVQVGSQKMVRSVPGELSRDHNAILELAQGSQNVTLKQLLGIGWTEQRAMSALQQLLDEGLALVDEGDPSGATRYWFPCLASAEAEAVGS
uniref:Vacuolar protein sorting-associated protein n=1 Tax=Tetraselmis sp. GSL018 TaxID=582737 RepID=A0A061R637_9CHLO